jgi:hypothetical protein
VTIRTAYLVIVIQALVIAGLIAYLLMNAPRVEPVGEPAGGHFTGSADAGDASPAASARARARAASRETDSRAPINPAPFVEPDDVAFSADDPVGIMLFGKVTRPDGKTPKGELHVSLADEETDEWRSSQVKSGSYAITGLRPGTWSIVSRNVGYKELKQPVQLTAAQPRQRLDLVFEPCTILKVKIITPEGQLLQEAIRAEKLDWNVIVGVVATLTAPSGDLPMTPYASHDDWGIGILRGGRGFGGEVPKGYTGVLELREGPPVFLSAVMRHVIIATKHVPAGAEEAEIVVPVSAVKSKLATLKTRIVDADTGAPITKARIEATDRQSGGAPYPVDENGNVVKEGLRPGLLHFSVNAEGYEYLTQYIRLEPGQINDLGTFRLNKGVTIEGMVVDEHGAPVKASVSYRNLDRIEFPQPLEVGMSYGGGGEGAFTITGAGRGRGVVIAEASDPRTVTAMAVNTAAGPVTNLRVVMKAGTRVAFEYKFDRSERYLVSLVDEAGTPWMSSYSGPWTMKMVIPPGSYTLRIHDDKTLRKSIPVAVGATPLRIPVSL